MAGSPSGSNKGSYTSSPVSGSTTGHVRPTSASAAGIIWNIPSGRTVPLFRDGQRSSGAAAGMVSEFAIVCSTAGCIGPASASRSARRCVLYHARPPSAFDGRRPGRLACGLNTTASLLMNEAGTFYPPWPADQRVSLRGGVLSRAPRDRPRLRMRAVRHPQASPSPVVVLSDIQSAAGQHEPGR